MSILDDFFGTAGECANCGNSCDMDHELCADCLNAAMDTTGDVIETVDNGDEMEDGAGSTQLGYDSFEVVGCADNGMEAAIWMGEDGQWYSELADPGEYCQGAAWGTDREAAIKAVMNEIEYVNHCVKMGY